MFPKHTNKTRIDIVSNEKKSEGWSGQAALTRPISFSQIFDKSAYKPHSVSFFGLASKRSVIIYLEVLLLIPSCSPPGRLTARAAPYTHQKLPSNERFVLLGLAPGGVYLASSITAAAGGLLHHRFTLTKSRV